MMRILHISHQYRPALGGSETYITDLSEELARRGHRVEVFTSRSTDYHTWRNELPAHENLAGVSVRRFASMPRTRLTWRTLEFAFKHYWPKRPRWLEPLVWFGNGPICPGMATAIRHNAPRFDLIHISQLHYAHSWLAMRAARKLNRPVVVSPLVHAEQPVTYDFEYLRNVLRSSDLLLALTEWEKCFLSEQVPGCRAAVLGSGLRLADYPPLDSRASRRALGLPEDAFVMLFLGRKTEYKGLDLCVRALQALKAEGRKVLLLAFGPETDYSRRLCRELGDLDGLIVRGKVSEQQKRLALSACDVLTMPSTGESFGIVFLEAWAYAKPVIGARIGAVASLVADRTNGLLIHPGSLTNLVTAIKQLQREPAMADRLGREGRHKLEQRYTIERLGDILEGQYARLIRHHTNHHVRQSTGVPFPNLS